MKTTRLLIPSAALLVFAGAGRASDVRVQTVFVSGDAAPGQGPLVFDFFSDPRLNSAGDVAFWADLAGPGVSENNNGSVWSNRSGAFALITREGEAAPFGAGLVFGSLPAPAFNDQDRVAFTGSLFDPVNPNLPTTLGLFRELSPGPGLEAIAVEGEPVPCVGCPPDDVLNIGLAPFSAAGYQAFASNNGFVIWSNRGGPLQPARFAGMMLGTSQHHGRLSNPYQRGDGSIAFFAPVLSSASLGTQPIAYGLYSNFTGQFGAIAVTGQPIQTSSAIKYKEVSAHPALERGMGNSVRMAYWATMTEGGVTTINDSGLWVTSSQTGGGLPRVREGDSAPGAGTGVFFGGFSRHPSLAAAPNGQYFLAFQGTLIGDGISNLNNSGLWMIGNTGGAALIAREGQQVPRLPAGTLYSSFTDPVVNEGGQVVFVARLRGPAVTPATSLVLMASERAAPPPGLVAGSVAPIARSGDAVLVGSVTRTVEEIYFDQHQPGAGSDAFTNTGTLIFKMAFKDPIAPPPPPPTPPFVFANALFTASLRCLADINADGGLTISDFAAFQVAYVAGDLRVTDFNEDGQLTIADFGSFQTAFVQGCP